MAYKQQHWNDYDETKTETQNIKNGAVVTSERMNNLENGVVGNYNILNSETAKKADLDQYRQKDAPIGMVDLSDEVKKTMSGETSMSRAIADKTVTPYKTTFIDSINAFNLTNTVDGYYVAWSDGTVRENKDYLFHNYIAVAEKEKWHYSHTAQIAFYDIEYKFVSGIQKFAEDKPMSFEIPKGVKYMRLSFNKSISDLNKIMLNRGEGLKGYIPFKLNMNTNYLNDIPGESILDGTIEPKKTTFMKRKNIAEQTSITEGVYATYTTGDLEKNDRYVVINELIPVNPEQQYTCNHDVQIPFFDKDGVYMTGLMGAGSIRTRTFTVPKGAHFMKANVLKEGIATYQIERGSTATEYESPDVWRVEPNYLPKGNQIGNNDDFELNLPPILYVVPGMTLEFYHNQICWTGNIENYHFKWIGKVGKAFKRKWSLTAIESMRGEHDLTCIVYDNNLNEVAKQTIKVVVTSYQFKGPKKIITIGDSLSNTTSTFKPWYQKVRQLSANTIDYVGTRGLKEGEMHEGRSGWTAGLYLTGTSYDFEKEGINPFWNPTTKKFDYQYYIDKTGIDADAVQIFLGTNGMSLDPTSTANSIKIMIENILQVRPNVPILLVHTLYRSNQDGIAKQGSNDGYTSSSGVLKLEEDKKVFNLIKRLNLMFKNYSNVVLVPLAHCHDSEYNYGDVLEKVNPRNTKQVSMPKESIHPQDEGYMQFADVFFCMYCAFNNF